MGFLFGHGFSRMDAAREATDSWINQESGAYCLLLSRVFRGNVVYSLHVAGNTTARTDVESGDSGQVCFIMVTLLQRSKVGWGYKSMDETCGPCYYNAPLSWLEKVTAPGNTFSRDWRAQVRAYHAQRKNAAAR